MSKLKTLDTWSKFRFIDSLFYFVCPFAYSDLLYADAIIMFEECQTFEVSFLERLIESVLEKLSKILI